MSLERVIAQSLMLALEIYRNHHNKPTGWMPTKEDWDAIAQDVKESTAGRLKADAREELLRRHD